MQKFRPYPDEKGLEADTPLVDSGQMDHPEGRRKSRNDAGAVLLQTMRESTSEAER